MSCTKRDVSGCGFKCYGELSKTVAYGISSLVGTGTNCGSISYTALDRD